MDSFAHISWFVLNVAVFLLFVYHLIRYTRIINKKIGSFPAFLFVVGMQSLLSSSNKHGKIEPIKINEEDSRLVSQDFKRVNIYENKLNDISLNITYQKDKDHTKFLPLSVNTSQLGVINGTKWKQSSISINRINDSNYIYSVHGYFDWSLFGIQIYTQLKHFKGTITLD